MRLRRTLITTSFLLLAATATTHAAHPGSPCTPTEARHSYGWPLGVFQGAVSWPPAMAIVFDTCAGPFDGDAEHGLMGGRFPAGTSPCLVSPQTSHHASGPGAQYWADDETGIAALAYQAGADGPSLLFWPPCATDGIISNDPQTDPFDCGAGAVGYFAPGVQVTPATLGENVPGNGACNPYDGHVWIVLLMGPVGPVFSTPISGHLWG